MPIPSETLPPGMQVTPLHSFPPREKWDDWVEYDAKAWPKKLEKRYALVPTVCFNCEAACGLVAYIDKQDHSIRKLEGNPLHPGSRGRNCAKGPATINQVNDPDRVFFPMKRVGPRGSGKFERVSWDAVLEDVAGRMRQALLDGRKTEIMYHVGRPGHDGYIERVLKAWGVDGHNSHTNVCSAAARLGYALWSGFDRPSPDYENAKFILLISSHLETGHYFNPHAQRIMDGKIKGGAKLCAIDVRLSNTASMADYWLAPRPGTEAMLLLGVAHVLLQEKLFDRAFLETWVDWRTWLEVRKITELTFARFVTELTQHYAFATPEAVAKETGIAAERLVEIAREIGKAGSRFAAHVWRNAASGNEGGWQVARCLQFVGVLTGSVGTIGGTNPAPANKFVGKPFVMPPPQDVWSELLYPREWPLAHHELSFLLPHLLKEGRGHLEVYFTRVYNPVWTNPDGMVWMEALSDEKLVGLHCALTPVWSETARLADYVLPMGVATERHDLMSQETHAARWISFRQPVLRTLLARQGKHVEWTYQANPGEVWEEDEFWIALSWRVDPDGKLGVRKFFESPYRPGERITIDEYYRHIFENSIPGLPEAAAKEGTTALEYMRRHGAFLVQDNVYKTHEAPLSEKELLGTTRDEARGCVLKDGKPVGVIAGGKVCVGFGTLSKKLEIHSLTMDEWKWPEFAEPCYIPSHVHENHLDRSKGEFVLISTFRLPTLIHTRSANSKWLSEFSNTNPVWIHPSDAQTLGVATGDLVRVTTRIGYYVNKAWVTEGIRPGLVGCSHHLGRWKLKGDENGVNRWQQQVAELSKVGEHQYRLRRERGVVAFEGADKDGANVWWTEGGVHQNLTFPVQPDPVSGMHCWHQKVTVTKGKPDDRYGDIFVDTEKSMQIFREWLGKTRPAPGPGGLRRPLHFARVARPTDAAYRIGE